MEPRARRAARLRGGRAGDDGCRRVRRSPRNQRNARPRGARFPRRDLTQGRKLERFLRVPSCVSGDKSEQMRTGQNSMEGVLVRHVSRKAIALGVLVAIIGLVVVAVATASSGKKSADVQVCVLLPDTKSSVRWVQFDAPAFAKALKAAGVTYSINNALNDPQKQKAQAQTCLARGAKVVIETSLDNGSAAAIEKLFTSKGGKAIDYDRQVIGGTASVYISFDGKKVGQAQANGIVGAMKANGTYKPTSVVAQLWGGQTDQNAFWFKSGNDAVFNPLFAGKKLKSGPHKFVPDWDANNAANIFNQMLVQTNNNIQ